MNLVLFIFLYGVFSSGISDFQTSFEEFPDAMPLLTQEKKEEQEEDKNKVPANKKMGNYYKDIKEYTFKTPSTMTGGPEISLKATTDVQFVLRNNNGTTTSRSIENVTEAPTEKPTTEPTVEPTEESVENFMPSTPKEENDSAFWTMLSEVLNETTMERSAEKDELFQAVPGSDVTSENKDKTAELEEVKLKLMLGISVMTLFLFFILLTMCCVTFYKLNKQSSKSICENEYAINPELATLSYFHPSEGVSDASFSKSPDSSTFWGNASSELRRSGTKRPISKPMTDMVSTASEDIGINYESDLLQSEEPSEEIQTDE
ncbi:MOB kinase activator 3B isoform X2 [Dasypus novemcinctus]|uniref:MOB kinase activator 3B isoform X2 n=1 Tax=Dasypus novemcinctus TaxID=9361 RepID=UPI00265F672D|nr:MOB kinase activator 3B isoform X2 [Dasypus novemcinctus]